MGDPFVTNQIIKLDNVVFAEAHPALRKTAIELCGQSWAAPMTIPDYVALNDLVSQEELVRDGSGKTWALTLQSDPSQVIASCFTTRKEVLIADPVGGFRMGTGYAIAAVHTNPRYRRLGMAAHLMRRVQGVMDQSSDCSALYSDIGKRYYRDLGWTIFPSAQVTLHVLTEEGRGIVVAHPGRTTVLTKADLPTLCAQAVEALKKRFEGLGADGRVHIAFSPSWPQIAWQLAREDHMARKLLGREIQNCGAITAERKSWIYWEHNFWGKKLNILRVVTSDTEPKDQLVEDITALLDAAVAEATHWGFKDVLLWNPDELVTLGAKGVGNNHETDLTVIFDERLDTAIPSLRWKGGQDTTDTVWEENGYFAHC